MVQAGIPRFGLPLEALVRQGNLDVTDEWRLPPEVGGGVVSGRLQGAVRERGEKQEGCWVGPGLGTPDGERS